MPITIATIKSAAETMRDMGRIRAGCIWFNPAVEVVRLDTDEVLHVRGIDEAGSFPGTAFVVEELGWTNIRHFKLKTAPRKT
jgi:hypothetical protein